MNLDIKKHYPKDWIVLQNRVVECFRGMSLDEKRLFIMATPLARTTQISSNDPIFISSSDFAKECGIDISTAYTALETASERLFTRFFGYTNAEGDRVKMRWLNKVIYKAGQGGTELYFTDEVLLLLREFDALNPYTKYKKEVVLRLKKDYSLDLYHLAKKHQTMGGFQITLNELFEQLGLPESYQDLSNLKKRVIKPSLDEITANTDIDLSYENIKKGRSVVGFKFTVKEKPKPKAIETGRDKNTIGMFYEMTDAQINMFGNQLSRLPEFSNLANGNESYDALASRIKDMLKDPEKQKIFIPHLRKLGFKAT
ncbi:MULTISPECIES: RepB family plasmid replication initiator protein [Acinetobacter]|uniref:RepB family plasmid replication initiator protein n=1 Tax=Acinetobacter TaxID=469 RepID=UPI000A3548BC|nr:RepB family plasmid replication initiator protein [Acinetobacter pittii]MDN5414015.1 replication initiation protein [Lactococcus raffinolactis]MDN5418803.1 replication initiation protein [Acinetobacter sp.]NAR62056.1 RepB family plasmid replication initiator protein [Acinetobacter haemolyticus]NAR68566.1 RepB family plasmid replication initiator protein [Acinetobacter haemolyticus]OTM62945.1 RepB family plasmid replication initiator protein [Acinetobacter pittii]